MSAEPKRYGGVPWSDPVLVRGSGITTDQGVPTASRADSAWTAAPNGFSHAIWTVELPSGVTATVELYSRLDFANPDTDSMVRLDVTQAITETSGVQQHLTAGHVAIRVHSVAGLSGGDKIRIARTYANLQGT
jgi:hypothetical protein